jgi:GTPase SAR1 family protein
VTFDNDDLLDDEDYDSEDSDDVKSTLSQTSLKSEYSIIVLGAAELGKSALVSRFMDTNVFVKLYNETIVDQYK